MKTLKFIRDIAFFILIAVPIAAIIYTAVCIYYYVKENL